jgi:glycosyltransferase involved in cell wall biosynthesis
MFLKGSGTVHSFIISQWRRAIAMNNPGTRETAPLVSVVMPNYNGQKWLEQSIGSVMEQTYRNWELVVVDDASTDSSVEIIEGLAARDERVLLHALPENSGNPSVARNAAAHLCRGKYVAFIDADDHWRPGKLQRQVALMEGAGTGAALCHGNMEISVASGGYLDGMNFSQGRLRSRIEGRCFENLLIRNFICTSSVMIRRDSLRHRPAWFDPEFRICQDWDLWLWLAWRHEFAYVPEALGTYRIHGGNLSSNQSLTRRESREAVRRWRGTAPFGVYLKAITARYAFDVLNMLPVAARSAIKRAMPWPR